MNFRQYKWTYQLFNFFKRDQLKHNIPLYKKYGVNKKYYSSVSSEDFKGIDAPLNIYDVEDSAVEMPKNAQFSALSESLQKSLLTWSKDGYVILPKFFSEEKVDTCNEEITKLIRSKHINFKYSNKLMFAFHQSQFIRSMGEDDRLLKVLNVLLGKEVDLFQSINFLEGSQQRTHSDSIHMTTFPYGNLIAAWVALEDIEEGAGPLHYYPGSHKLPYVMNRDYGNVGSRFKLGDKKYSDYEDHIEGLIQDEKLDKKQFLARKGDVLIWHANLLHGGEPVLSEGSTRKSMVFHYYTRDSICFHEITQRPTLKESR